jgi:hypothetical protein
MDIFSNKNSNIIRTNGDTFTISGPSPAGFYIKLPLRIGTEYPVIIKGDVKGGAVSLRIVSRYSTILETVLDGEFNINTDIVPDGLATLKFERNGDKAGKGDVRIKIDEIEIGDWTKPLRFLGVEGDEDQVKAGIKKVNLANVPKELQRRMAIFRGSMGGDAPKEKQKVPPIDLQSLSTPRKPERERASSRASIRAKEKEDKRAQVREQRRAHSQAHSRAHSRAREEKKAESHVKEKKPTGAPPPSRAPTPAIRSAEPSRASSRSKPRIVPIDSVSVVVSGERTEIIIPPSKHVEKGAKSAVVVSTARAPKRRSVREKPERKVDRESRKKIVTTREPKEKKRRRDSITHFVPGTPRPLPINSREV